MLSTKRNSSNTSVCTLDLACKLLRLKSYPSKRYLIGIPLSPSWKASVSMAENIMLNSVEASTQPCLAPFVIGNGSENSPSFWTLASIQSWSCRTTAMNLAGQPKLCHNFPKSLTTDNVKCFGKVDKGHIESHILFLAFLLKLPCCENHVNCSLSFLNPQWLSGRSPDCPRCSFSWFSRTLARIFPAIDNKEMPR